MSRTKVFEGICLQSGLNDALSNDNPEKIFPEGDYFACRRIDCPLSGEIVSTTKSVTNGEPVPEHYIYTDGRCGLTVDKNPIIS